MSALPVIPTHSYSLRAANYCLSLSAVTADVKWQCNLVFSVANKMFCVVSMDEPAFQHLSFKVDAHRFLELTELEGLIPAPYMARNHWITQTKASALPFTQTKILIQHSYDLVVAKLPKKTQRLLKE